MEMTEVLYLDISGQQTGKTTRSINGAIKEHGKTGNHIILGGAFIGALQQQLNEFPEHLRKYVHIWKIGVTGARVIGFGDNPIIILDEFDHIKNWDEAFMDLLRFKASKIFANTSPSFLRTDKHIAKFEKNEKRDPILELIQICRRDRFTRKLWLGSLDRDFMDLDIKLIEAGLFYGGDKEENKSKHVSFEIHEGIGQAEFNHKCLSRF